MIILRPAASINGLKLVSSAVVSSPVAAVDFTVGATYDWYELVFADVHPSTDAVPWVRVSIDSSTYQTTGYTHSTFRSAATVTTAAAPATSAFVLGGTCDSAALAGGMGGRVVVYNPGAAAARHKFGWQVELFDNTNMEVAIGGGRDNNSANALTNIRFMFSTGNVNDGYFQLYGGKR